MRPLGILLLAVALSAVSAEALHARTVVAFGYLANKSAARDYDYLETLFPNSFAASLGAVYDVGIKKPRDIDVFLKKKHNTPLNKSFESFEIPVLADRINSDIFIYGDFEPLPGNRIKIVMNIYLEGSREIFSFTNVGMMETEIFRLVDRISLVVLEFLQEERLFRAASMARNSKIVLLSNLDGAELNEQYIALMKRGFNVLGLQSGEIRNKVRPEDFDRLKYLRSLSNSYDKIADSQAEKFHTGSWAGDSHRKGLEVIRKTYLLYDLNYLDTELNLLSDLRASFNDRADYLLIMGYDKGKSGAWVRCVDLRKKELIWMKANVPHLGKGERIDEITGNMLDLMSREKKNPFKSGKNPAENI